MEKTKLTPWFLWWKVSERVRGKISAVVKRFKMWPFRLLFRSFQVVAVTSLMSVFLFRLNLVSICYLTLFNLDPNKKTGWNVTIVSWGLPVSGCTVQLLKIQGSACTIEMRWTLYVSRLFMMSPAQDDSSCIWNVLTLVTGKKRTNVIFVCVKCFKLVCAVDTKCKTQRQDWETNSVRVNSFGGRGGSGDDIQSFDQSWCLCHLYPIH